MEIIGGKLNILREFSFWSMRFGLVTPNKVKGLNKDFSKSKI